MPKLNDPWFEAEFYGNVSSNGLTRQESMEGAQGLLLWCPCGYGKPEYPVQGARPHAVLVPFLNPRGAPKVPDDHGPHKDGIPVRWTVSGSGIADLTISPSIAVGKPDCWHGYITSGEVRT